MKEHPFVTCAKLGLLAFVAVMLVLNFKASTDTQDKVLRSVQVLDEVKDQVADLRRTVGQGVRVAAGPSLPGTSSSGTTPASTGPRVPGFTSLLVAEPDLPRPPDDEIDFDAEFRYGL